MFLIGIGNQTKSTAFTLLAHETIGYTLVPISGYSYYTSTVGLNSDGFLMFTTFGETLYSVDGINWKNGTNIATVPGVTPTDYGTELYYGTHEKDTWYNSGLNGLQNIVVTSKDGINWSTDNGLLGVSNPYSAFKYGKSDISAYGIGITLAINFDGVVSRKLDSSSDYWQLLGDRLQGDFWLLLAYSPDNDKFMAVSRRGYSAITSINPSILPGAEWSHELINGIPNLDQYPYAVDDFAGLEYGNKRFWLVDSRGRVFTTNPDNYKSTAIITNPLSYVGHQDLAYNSGDRVVSTVFANEYLYILLASGRTYWTNDGLTFFGGYITPITDKGYTWEQILFINNKFVVTSFEGIVAVSENGQAGWQVTNLSLPNGHFVMSTAAGNIKTLKEVQIAIGGQGDGGTAETLSPVKVYTVPSGKTAKITEIKINNLHSSAITYDLGKLSSGQTLTESNSIKWDKSLAGNSSDTINQVINMVAGESITILPSSVNTVSVAVYGSESNA